MLREGVFPETNLPPYFGFFSLWIMAPTHWVWWGIPISTMLNTVLETGINDDVYQRGIFFNEMIFQYLLHLGVKLFHSINRLDQIGNCHRVLDSSY